MELSLLCIFHHASKDKLIKLAHTLSVITTIYKEFFERKLQRVLNTNHNNVFMERSKAFNGKSVDDLQNLKWQGKVVTVDSNEYLFTYFIDSIKVISLNTSESNNMDLSEEMSQGVS